MRNFSRVSLAVAVSAALVGFIALPATAAPTADTTVTVIVPVGELSVSAPGTANLGTVTPGSFSEVTLTPVQVSDTRAGEAGWNVAVGMTDFSNVGATRTIPASAATYTPAAASTTGNVTVTPTTLGSLATTAATAQTATAVSGNNTATWDAVLRVTAPAGTLADSYTATLTHSFL